MNDHCLIKRPKKQAAKEASGAHIFLAEEIGDARLRCAQLKKYIDRALQLIEKSPQRDHFFEVAGNLINNIPDTLLRLDKALGASAMAISRMQFEEIKDELLPEKVDELESALEDTRVRRVVRRTQQAKDKQPMKRTEAIARLNKIAASVEAGSALDASAVTSLIADLEGPVTKTASSGNKTAKEIRKISNSLGRKGSKLSPMKAAQLLRGLLTMGDVRVASDDFLATSEPVAATGPTATVEPFASSEKSSEESLAAEAKRSRFETNKPADPTENMDEGDADKWKIEHLKNKDNFTSDDQPKEASSGAMHDLVKKLNEGADEKKFYSLIEAALGKGRITQKEFRQLESEAEEFFDPNYKTASKWKS